MPRKTPPEGAQGAVAGQPLTLATASRLKIYATGKIPNKRGLKLILRGNLT
jgi:hypothetical protein